MDGGGTKRCKKTDKRSPKGRAADLERESGKRKRKPRKIGNRSKFRGHWRAAKKDDTSNNSPHSPGPHSSDKSKGRKQEKQERGGGAGRGDGGRGRGGRGVAGNSGQEPPQEKVKIMYTNTQSLPGKVSELEALTVDLKPDKILLCETWCNDNVNSAVLGIDRYELQQDLRRDRTDTTNGIGGGLIVYAREGLVC